MKLIALSGRAQSGKNTVAKIIRLADAWDHSDTFKRMYPNKKHFIEQTLRLHSEVGYTASTYREISFALLLKCAVAFIFNIDASNLEDPIFKNTENCLKLTDSEGHVYTYREILQRFGTEVGRSINPNLWVSALFNMLDKDEKYIITDVRFINEAEACLENEATLIRIERNGDQMSHQSETDLDSYEHFDYTINNNGSIEELIDKVLQLNIL